MHPVIQSPEIGSGLKASCEFWPDILKIWLAINYDVVGQSISIKSFLHEVVSMK